MIAIYYAESAATPINTSHFLNVHCSHLLSYAGG